MHGFMNLAQSHPALALAVVLLVACAESLAVVGTLVPAAIVMFGAGALVGAGALPLWPTLLVAAAGAIVGDSLSYELGRAREPQLRGWRLLQRHPAALARAEDFLQRHGSMSVLLARFTGPLRAFVPLLAGFARLPRQRFYAVNAVSALLWAPAHILPGVLFGASLTVAEAVSGRLAVLLLLLLLLVWLATWLVPVMLRWTLPRLAVLRDLAVTRARDRDGRVARWTLMLLDPARPGSPALLAGTALLLGSGWLFFGVLEDVVAKDPLVQLDLSVFQFLQGLRTAPVDQFMVSVTEMGSVGVLLPLVAVVAAWLSWRGWRRTALYWLGVAAFGEVLVQLLKFTLGRHRPIDLYSGVERFSFPSGHATVTTVLLSFLGFLLARRQPLPIRMGLAAAAAVYIGAVALSRLYLGAHWMSDVLGGMSLGLAWVALVATVYTGRGVDREFAPRELLLVVIGCLALFGTVSIHRSGAADLARYQSPPAAQVLAVNDWLDSGWRQLPAQRFEVAGEPGEPLPLQWGDEAATVQMRLVQAGWQPATGWTVTGALGWLAGTTPWQVLPVLPRFDRGQPARLVFQRLDPQRSDERQVLRLWRAGFDLRTATAAPVPLWYGTIYREARRQGRLMPGVGVTQASLSASAIASELAAASGSAPIAVSGPGRAVLVPPLAPGQ